MMMYDDKWSLEFIFDWSIKMERFHGILIEISLSITIYLHLHVTWILLFPKKSCLHIFFGIWTFVYMTLT